MQQNEMRLRAGLQHCNWNFARRRGDSGLGKNFRLEKNIHFTLPLFNLSLAQRLEFGPNRHLAL
jgi:hypothetical protein